MPNSLKRVGGSLANPVGVLYTCPAATQAWVKTIVVVNGDVAPRQFKLYADPASSPISALPATLGAGAMYRDTDGHALASGDTVQGWSDVGSVCLYRLSIVEKT
jgi:hypothetical protein